ncbi:MAG: GC-type dockerin domain-anchored protein [Phycisphaerales bacterium JB039]
MPGTGAWSVIPNGDFESGIMSPWVDFTPGKGVFRVTDAEAWSGAFSAGTMSGGPGSGPGYAAISASIAVTRGETYILSGFMNTGNLEAGALYIDLNDIPGDPHVPACFDLEGWQFGWRQWVADRTSVTIRIVRDGVWAPGDAAYFDDIALTPLADFVPPDSTYACYADCEPGACPGALDLFDFLCFQNAFALGDPYADCDGTGVLDFFDFLCYQNAFAAGCP